ncbi:MAG TPA: hypothetical protein VMM92_02735 [Thermoanaerobaculia bacterium]|nr:hypothetical protein [Thermoanaerobaculia bacterium]
MPSWSPVDLLPGVWFGLLLLLLHQALRRWFDAVPGAVCGAFLFALLIPFGPVLVGGQILLPLDSLRGEPPLQELLPTDPHGNPIQGDLIQLVTPSLLAVRKAYSEGRWPLWNPLVGAGMPLLSDPQAQAGAPLVLLASVLPVWRAAGVTAALRLWVALVFGFLLLRRQGLHSGPALAGAFSFGLGGFLLLWVGWPLANCAAFLPLLLYSLIRCDQEGGRRDSLLLAIATFSLLAGGHPETIAYAFLLAFAFFLEQLRRRGKGQRRTLLFAVGLGAFLGTAAAAPLLLPAAAYLPQTLRSARLLEQHSALPSEARGGLAARLLPVAAPNAYGNSRFLYYWGRLNSNEDASGFTGTAILLLVLLGLLGGRAQRRFPQERVLWGIAFLALFFLAWPPGGGVLRLSFPLSFALSYLGACSLERWRAGEGRRLFLVFAAVGLATLLVWAYLAHPDPSDPHRLDVLRFGWLRWQLRFLTASALLLLAGRGQRWMPPLVAVLIGGELLLAHRPANPPAPQRLLWPENAALQFLAEHLGQDRMAGLGTSLPPNLASLYGLADARVYNPMAPWRYLEHLAPITLAFRGEAPELGRAGDPLYRFLGVRYLLTGPTEDCPSPLATAFKDSTATICEVPDPVNRLFLPRGPRLDLNFSEVGHLSTRLPQEASGQILGSSIYQDGGWQLLADGRRLPSDEGDTLFVAARIPPGSTRVHLLYRPPAFLPGCLLAALALSLGVALWCPPPRKRLE